VESSIPSKVIRGPKISKLGHVTYATPTLKDRFMVHTSEGSVLHVCPLVIYNKFCTIENLHHVRDIPLVSILWPWNPGQRSHKVIRTDTYRSATYDFLITFHSNYRPISHRFRDKWRFLSKITNFYHPRLFIVTAERVTLVIGYRQRGVRR